MLLGKALSHIVKTGTLTITHPSGHQTRHGDGTGKPVAFSFHDAKTARRMLYSPELGLGEAYMDGTLTLDQGTIYDLLALLTSNLGIVYKSRWLRTLSTLRLLKRRLDQCNPIGRAQKNVAHHYDLDSQFYDLFLDSDRQYSCGYFHPDDHGLEQAQLAKKQHLAAKLDLKPDQSLLDIGCGWGGLGLYLANLAGVRVTGVTLSKEQHRIASHRAQLQNLKHRSEFLIQDYRTLNKKFDRIVSVGMFEHVGVGHYREYFSKVHELLTHNGVAVIHTIGRSDGPSSTNPWIRKYIFPGGYIPVLSEILPAIEKAGLFVCDIEVLRLHYAYTLRHWRNRFVKNWDQAVRLYDERFCRMWEFYLAGSECAFRFQGMSVFQIQLTRDIHTLPLTRDYMSDSECSYRERSEPGATKIRVLAGE